METVIVYGPQGCGKTSSADALKKRFGCHRVIDEWDGKTPLPEGALALTNHPGPYAARARVVRFEKGGVAA